MPRIRQQIRQIDPLHPNPELVFEAGDIIRHGGMVIFPTQCLYGLGANAFDTRAVGKIFQIKQRSFQKPILVLINHKKELNNLVREIPPVAESLMEKFWPGSITLVFKAKETISDALTAGTGKIGVRLCAHRVAAALVEASKTPLTGTSANLSGIAGAAQIDDIDAQVLEKADLILDAGQLRGSGGSTVIDVTTDAPVILREGTIATADIQALLQH